MTYLKDFAGLKIKRFIPMVSGDRFYCLRNLKMENGKMICTSILAGSRMVNGMEIIKKYMFMIIN